MIPGFFILQASEAALGVRKLEVKAHSGIHITRRPEARPFPSLASVSPSVLQPLDN